MAAPEIPGHRIFWVDEFEGAKGAPVSTGNWQSIVTSGISQNSNHEVQEYTTSPNNAYLSGDGSLVIIPKHNSTHDTWTSARLECKHAFTCDPGHKMILQSEIRLGNNPASEQQGIWPAFWALGNSIRSSAQAGWPACGEWDILELVNGSTSSTGTLHFSYGGQVDASQDPKFHKGGIAFTPGEYHTWALKVDRTPGTYSAESLTWSLDGTEVFQITDAEVGNNVQWGQVAHSPFFPILNVAVGGDWPNGAAGGPTPNNLTVGGIESGMQVKYVAVYK